MGRCYWQLRVLCTRRARLEPDVRGGGAPRVELEVERAADEQIDTGGDRQPHQHRDIGAAESTGDGPGVEARAEEGNHDREAHEVRGEPAPVPTAVHAGGIEDLANRVVALAHEIEVDQVDRRPGREEIKKHGEQVLEAVDEVAGGGEGDRV